MPNPQVNLQLIRMLTERLECVSVDSIWAHRASRVRGALLRQLQMIERALSHDGTELNTLTAISSPILEESLSKRISVR